MDKNEKIILKELKRKWDIDSKIEFLKETKEESFDDYADALADLMVEFLGEIRFSEDFDEELWNYNNLWLYLCRELNDKDIERAFKKFVNFEIMLEETDSYTDEPSRELEEKFNEKR